MQFTSVAFFIYSDIGMVVKKQPRAVNTVKSENISDDERTNRRNELLMKRSKFIFSAKFATSRWAVTARP